MKLTATQRKKLKRSAIMLGSQCIHYVCPENRAKIDDASNGHFFRICVSEELKGRKHPKCPYCGTKTKMINYDRIKRGKEEKWNTNVPNADTENNEPSQSES
jgi:hypothetical protein